MRRSDALGLGQPHQESRNARASFAKFSIRPSPRLSLICAKRGLLDRTVVLCGGEFGRTPRINPFDGRDHWPHGFSMALAGGGLRGGQVIGATDPEGGRNRPTRTAWATCTPRCSRPWASIRHTRR